MNKLKVKIIAMLCAVSLALGCVGTAVFAWFLDKLTTQVNFTATAHRSYFESGEGTEESPFEIAHPRQLYYLSWLQELGYFNQPDTEDNTKIKQFHFFLSKDLDMTGFTLPPIGTPVNPFVGTFDGKGYKISNLTVTNEDSAHTDTPSGDLEDEIQIIGVFGVIGSIGEAGTLTVDGNNYTYDTAKNSVKNFLIDSATLITKTPKDDKTLIGIAAGYVNGDIESVGVYDCSIKVASGLSVLDEENITDKISGYSLVGFSKAAYDAYVEKEGAEGNGWGGSVAMQKVHERLAAAHGTNYTSQITYTYRKYMNVFFDKDGNQIGDPVQTDTDSAYYRYKNYNSTGGSVLLAQYAENSTNNTFYYINGGVRIRNTRYFYKDTTGYSISDSTGNYHLVGNTSGQISQSTTEGTVWIYDNGKLYIETVGNQATTSTKYYLGVDNYGRLTCTQTSATWTASGNNVYSDDNYIVHVNGANGGWAASDSGKIIKITDGTDYLGYSSLNAVNSASAAEWLVSNGYIHTVMNGTHYYLNRNNTTLSITSTPSTAWDVSSDGTSISSGEYVLTCDGGVWKLTQSSMYITDGNGHYLTGNGSIGNSNTQSGASKWILTPYGNNYYISTTYNNNTYYLRNNSGTLALTTNTNQRTAWTISDGIIKNGNYQITYDSGWKLINVNSLPGYLTDGNGHYINNPSGSTINVATSQNNATQWIKDSDGSFYPSNSTNKYLTYRNYYGLSCYNGGTAFELNNNNYLYASTWSSTYYIRYNNNSWTTTTTASQATTFYFETISPKINTVSTETFLTNENVSYGGTERNSESIKCYTSETNEYLDYSQGYNTYIPLIVDSDDSTIAKKSNTGYIVGGSQDTTTGGTYPYRAGDIRVSYYAISENISNSYSSYDNSLNESRVYTINASGRQSISQIGANNLQRYTSASAEFLSTLKNQDNVYGLHFMSADISIDNLVTAAHVQVNGDTYENYEMPASSIDFNLKEKGYINFFAGTYFTNNNSFFSLHRIFRNESHKITAIKEISEIYGTDDENLLYIYKYEDGTMTYSDGAAVTSMPQGYELMFKTAWIKKQTTNWQDDSIYYFEIPADSGEYALGSVNGGTGAYLLHLDISANAGDVDRSVMDYLTGVDFVTASDTSLLAAIADKNPTAAFGLKNLLPGNIGTVKVKREEDGDVITFKIICSDTSLNESQLKEYIRYYYITPENKTVKIEWVIN